jgi:centrosomal protein CEP104
MFSAAAAAAAAAVQGHDAVGRPLLERALAIQEAALGPSHPDVMAIRDVLNSE